MNDTFTPSGYRGPMAHSYSAGCAGHHPPSQPCPKPAPASTGDARPQRLPHMVIDIPALVRERDELAGKLEDSDVSLAHAEADRDRFRESLRAVNQALGGCMLGGVTPRDTITRITEIIDESGYVSDEDAASIDPATRDGAQ